MAIYNRKGLVTYREGVIDLKIEDFEDILNESPSLALNDDKRDIKFNYIINGDDEGSEHGPRLKLQKGAIGNKNLITFIVCSNGDLELRRSLLGKGCVSDSTINKIASLAGGFSKYAVKEIYDAYYSKNYDKERMNKVVGEYNSLSKTDKSKYIKSAKSGMKRSNK